MPDPSCQSHSQYWTQLLQCPPAAEPGPPLEEQSKADCAVSGQRAELQRKADS